MQMIQKVVNAPINTFFDVTPTGTIMNRFSQDISILDTSISFTIGGIHVMFYQMMGVLFVIVAADPLVLVIFPLIFFLCWYLFKYAVKAYRESNRIEAITKSPLLNFINESFSGAATIRAFKKESQFIEKTYEILDKNILAN